MLKFMSWAATLLLFCSVGLSQDSHLQCYSCAHVDTGDLELIEGFQNSPVDKSCKWGNQPDDTFLIDCTAEYQESGYEYFHVCTQMIINGRIISEGKQISYFNGTLWGCATRRAIPQLPIIEYTDAAAARVSKECREGTLSVVKDNFRDATGSEFLQNMSSIFESLAKVKFCTCDFDACWDRGPPTVATTTTIRATTEDEAGETDFVTEESSSEPSSSTTTSRPSTTTSPTTNGETSETTESFEPPIGSAPLKNMSLVVFITSLLSVMTLTTHLSGIL